MLAVDPPAIDEGCAEALADGLALDWASFDAEPGPVAPGDGALYPVLLGALALVSNDYGSVGDLVDAPGAWTWGREELARFAEEEGLTVEESAGELLWRYQLRHVDRTVLRPALTTGGHYSAGTMQLPEAPELHAAPPTWMASVYVHEAAHDDGPYHGRCDDGSWGCDADLDGVYGLQALVLVRQRGATDPWETDALDEVNAALFNVCARVDSAECAFTAR